MGGCSFSGKTSTKSDSVIRSSNNQSPIRQRNHHNLNRPAEYSHNPNHDFHQGNTAHGNNNNQGQTNCHNVSFNINITK